MGKRIWGENNPSSSRSTNIRLRYLLLPLQKKWKKPKPPKPRIQTQKITNKQTKPSISITSYLSCQRIKNGSPAQRQEDISPLNTPLLLTPGWEPFPPQREDYIPLGYSKNLQCLYRDKELTWISEDLEGKDNRMWNIEIFFHSYGLEDILSA